MRPGVAGLKIKRFPRPLDPEVFAHDPPALQHARGRGAGAAVIAARVVKTAALVVGCQEYPHLPAGAQDGPVGSGAAPHVVVAPGAGSRAVAMCNWLVGPGGVDPSNMRLLLSPASRAPVDGVRAPDGQVRVDGPADLECFTTELRRLLTGASGDRLYVYIAARCCVSDPVRRFLGQPLILLSDFDPTAQGTGSVALEELAAHLGHADFREVVTVVDCAPGVHLRRRIQPAGLGAGWLGRRRTGAPMLFRVQAPAEADWGTTSSGSGAASTVTDAFLTAVTPDGRPLRWSALERQLASVMSPPPTVSGANPSMLLTPLPDGRMSGRSASEQPVSGGPAGGTGVPVDGVDVVGGVDGVDAQVGGVDGEVELRCADPNAMLIVEDGSGLRRAVGIGSISGRLPAGRYTALLADPCGADPRVPLSVTSASTARAVLAPRSRRDGFLVSEETAVLWSSPAAQLAMATSALWAHGHQSFLLVGGGPALPSAADLLDGFPDRFPARGTLTAAGAGWWVARPVNGPWHGIGIDGRLLTVPAAPDSVTAVAISPSGVSVALFDTTHPESAEIAAQDRVQEYLAIGRLGAADLTSRSAVHAGQRWPWGASAAIRRFIDRTRASRAGEISAPEHPADVPDGAPPHEFRADVPPPLRRLLVGRGPWAVWLDWPAAGQMTDGTRLTRSG